MPANHIPQRIICFVPSDVSELIAAFALMQGLRRHFSGSHLAVACDAEMAPLVEACPAVDEVVVLQHHWFPGLAAWKNSKGIRKFDIAIAARAAVDGRLASLVKLSKAQVRIGFERKAEKKSSTYTDPVALPGAGEKEHRTETLLRLLQPVGLVNRTNWGASQLELKFPDSIKSFVQTTLTEKPFSFGKGHVFINLSSRFSLKFSENDLISIGKNLLSATPFSIILVASPKDSKLASEIALVLASERVGVIETMAPLEYAALIETSVFLVTVEDDAAHLALATSTPALVVWPDGPFEQTHSRSGKHVMVRLGPKEKKVPLERAWQGMQTLLSSKKLGIERKWADVLDPTPPGPTTN